VEIVALYRGVNLLILDEPTAVLPSGDDRPVSTLRTLTEGCPSSSSPTS
jgi:ABC-type uncharacterized transport system ATPase subunit